MSTLLLPGWAWLAAYPVLVALTVALFGGLIQRALTAPDPEEFDAACTWEGNGGVEASQSTTRGTSSC